MANTFKVITFDGMSASAGTPEDLYTAGSGVTGIVMALVIANIHTADVTVDVKLVSDTANRGGTNDETNDTSFLLDGVTIPVGTSINVLKGQVVETTDVLQVDCSVTDKVSVTLSILERT